MRYTHNLKIIRQRKNANKASLTVTVCLLLLILILGFTLLDARQFFGGFIESLIRVSAAYLISMLLAIILTLIVTSSAWLEQISIPILDVLQSFPSFALYPLFVLWFGKRAIVTIFILIITMIWPILFTLFSAKKQIKEEMYEAAYVYGARNIKYLIYVFFPLLFPALVTGSIVSWGEAWEAIIAAEIIVAIPGIGTYLATAGASGHTQTLIVGVFLLLTILFIINKYIWLSLLNISTRYQQE